MDNGWTAMTGMQVNPGTSTCFQAESSQTIDIAKIIPALGVDQFFIMDPFDMEQATETVKNAIQLPGVKVILSRQECAIQVGRRGEERGKAVVDLQKCVVCKLCINITGCPALSIEEDKFMIDEALCNGCGLCAAVCNLDAIQIEVAE
jgi:indolepyruvate ferredoxin oxidoreductase alpha subunit